MPQELHPQDPALASEENTGHQYQPLLLILSLRGIELYFLPQVHSEIGRDRQTPKVLAGCKRPEGRGAENQPSETEQGAENPYYDISWQSRQGPKFVHVFCDLEPPASLNNLLVYYAVCNKLEG